MKIRSNEFSIKEFGGALGDFGTLLPFVIGYIAICGLNPFGLLVSLGLVKILVGAIHKIPLAVQPKKAIGAVAITRELPPGQICGAGIGLGLFWLFASTTGLVRKLEKITPHHVIIAIQVSLAVQLAIKALSMMSEDLYLSISCLLIGLVLLKVRIFPASIALLLVGITHGCFAGTFSLSDMNVSVPAVELTLPSFQDVCKGMMAGGIAQIPLTLTNACLATASLSRKWFPDRPVSARRLALNMGIINSSAPLVGGMPMCHGAGGFAAQYAFGARTGGAMIMQGALFLFVGAFFSGSIITIFKAIPHSVLGTMLLIAAFYLGKGLREIPLRFGQISTLLVVVVASLLSNLAVGYALAMLIVLIKKLLSR